MQATDVLRDRMQEPDGLQRMVVISLAAHVAVAAALLLAPGRWLTSRADEPRSVMTITLGGGGEGPRTGSTAIGGRPVQVQTPPEEAKRPEPQRAPAAKAPEMTVPTKEAPRRATGSTAVKQAPDDARGRTPTKGAETTAGSAASFTGARGQGFGLSAGGGPGSGSTLDVADFCCPDYLNTMIERIQANWNQRQDVTGEVVVRFTIQRSGELTSVSLERGSGYTILDLAAQRAVLLTKQLPPLPMQFPNPTLTVHLNFQYQR
jgi:TonB family protein